jgi:hypothetical protein
VYQALRRSVFDEPTEMDVPLKLLVDHGCIRVVERASTGGRKPSPVIEVNPKARGGAR